MQTFTGNTLQQSMDSHEKSMAAYSAEIIMFMKLCGEKGILFGESSIRFYLKVQTYTIQDYLW